MIIGVDVVPFLLTAFTWALYLFRRQQNHIGLSIVPLIAPEDSGHILAEYDDVFVGSILNYIIFACLVYKT